MFKVRKLTLTAIITLSVGLLSLGGTAAAAKSRVLVVDDNKVECRNADYTSIQAAVTAASPGDTIKVCPGTYVEQVNIPAGKNGLTLRSERKDEAIIKAPPAMAGQKAIVNVAGATGITISSFTISGPGGGPCDSLRYGVRVDGGGSADILDNHITSIRDTPFSGCQNGIGVLLGRASEGQVGRGSVQRNTIDDYQKGGVVVSGPGSSGDVGYNTVVGVGPSATIAQNGVQVSGDATGSVHHNTISGNVYSPQTFASAGVLLFDPGAVEVSHNDLSQNDESIYVNDTDGAVVSHNTITGSTFDGIGLVGATNCTISFNDSSFSGFDGIYVASDSEDNQIDHNRLSNNTEHDAHDDSVGPGTGGTANLWEHNGCSSLNEENRPDLCQH
ncbi:MAG TPA: right-handed parallel beta-helix repeat-containing protein [Chloroflexia bacterium]|jgi:parallel beta-helix repeat protein